MHSHTRSAAVNLRHITQGKTWSNSQSYGKISYLVNVGFRDETIAFAAVYVLHNVFQEQ